VTSLSVCSFRGPSRNVTSSTLLTFIFLVVGLSAMAQRVGPLTEEAFRNARAPYNPAPFQNNLASPSSPVLFMLSEHGKLLTGAHPNMAGILKAWGVNAPARHVSGLSQQSSISESAAAPPDQSNTACNAPAGALFNREPKLGSPKMGIRAPQNEESVDYLPQGGLEGADLIIEGANDYRGVVGANLNFAGTPEPGTWGLGVTGYYVHRYGGDCGADFEGALPHVTYAVSGESLFGQGDPVVAIDSGRGLVYGADLRFGHTATGIGLHVSTVANLNSKIVCPKGTHLLDSNANDTVSTGCWPTGILLNPQSPTLTFIDKPHMRVDERSSGTGAGDVYVTWSNFDLIQGTSSIQITACRQNPASAADCAGPLTISGADSQTQFSHIVVHPDGVITITYVSVIGIPTRFQHLFEQQFDIKYVSCRPSGAPAVPSCSPPSLVTSEKKPLYFGGVMTADYYRVVTYPTHDYRIKNGKYEEFVAWSRCKSQSLVTVAGRSDLYPVFYVECPDADVHMTWSQTDSTGAAMGWAPVTAVNDRVHDQVMPWVKTDHSREIVNIAYMSAEKDPFGHRLYVMENQIPLSGYAPSPPILITTKPSEPFDDPMLFGAFIGDYIGMTAKGNGATSRAYIGTTAQYYKGLVNGVPAIDEDNVVSALDY
jgi:hypothetical protein